MPDRPRRALRLLAPRSRHKTPLPPPAPSSSNASLSNASLSPWASPPRARSLNPPASAPTTTSRACDSLPATWSPAAPFPAPQPAEYEHEGEPRRDRRVGRRFEDLQSPRGEPCACTLRPDASTQTPSFTTLSDDLIDDEAVPVEAKFPASSAQDEKAPTEKLAHIPAAMLEELAALREAQQQQTILVEASLSAAAAQAARLEAALDALRAREVARRAGPAEVVLVSVVNALAALLLYAFTWLVAKPCGGIWKVVKRVRGGEELKREVRRRSWRLSGVDGLGSDPFLAGAAKRLSFSAAALHD